MNFYWRDGNDQVNHFYKLYLNIKLTELSPSYTYAAEQQVMRTVHGPHFR